MSIEETGRGNSRRESARGEVYGEPEGTPLPRRTLYTNFSIHNGDQTLRQREP